MTPQEAFQIIKNTLQPSVITQLAAGGTIETYQKLAELFAIVDAALIKDQSSDSER